MKNIKDFSHIKLGNLTGALRHHLYFTTDKNVMDEIRAAVLFIEQNGTAAYIKKEYPNVRYNTKNIIINNISGRLLITDGNRHCVSLVIAKPDLTIGELLDIEPNLFRYWEEGYEEGGDTAYQPYVTYIPLSVNVSRIPEARQGTDDKGQKINIIPSNIPYDSDVFDERDRGRSVSETAHAFEVEEIYSAQGELVKRSLSLMEILGYCGKMYEMISKINIRYGFVAENSGYDHTLIWYIAGRVLSMSVDDGALRRQVQDLSNKELAEKIFGSIDAWVSGEKR